MVVKTLNNSEVERSRVNKRKESKIRQIKVSSKRQITIPKHFYDALGIGQELICELRDNEIVLRRVPEADDFSEEILKDLVKQGFNGNELIKEFQRVKSKIRPAVEKLLEESRDAAKDLNNNGDEQTEELFGDLKR